MSDRLQSLCVDFRHEALVASCGVVDARGLLVAFAGAPADALAQDAALVHGLWLSLRARAGTPDELTCTVARRCLIARALGPAHVAFAWFDHRSSLALVRLRLRALVTAGAS